MRRMKDSGVAWIGEIPEGWEVTPLFSVFQERKCKNIGLKEKNVLSLSYGKIIKRNIESNLGLMPVSFETYNIVKNMNIVLRLTDLQNDKTSLRVGIVTESGIITSAYTTLESRNIKETRFFYFLLHSYDELKILYNMGNGVRQNLKFAELSQLPLLSPPLPEQHCIADYLDAKCAEIDRSMELVRQSMDKLKAYKMSVITEAVTKGLDPDVPMKDSGVTWIGEIPEGWKIIRLKFIAPVQGGYSFKSDKFSTECGIPLVRMNNLKRGILNIEDAVKIQEEDIIEEFFINENDILIGLSGNIGDTGSLGNYAVASKGDLPCLLNQRVGRFNVSKSINYKLIVYFLDTDFFKQPLILDSNGTAQFNISPYDIGEVLVPLPPHSTQQDIIAYLDTKCAAIDAIIAQKQEQLDKLAAYRKSLIYECVTGKREVAA